MWTTTSFSLLILFVFFGAAYAQDSHPNDEKLINWMIESIESEDKGMVAGSSGNGPSRRFMAAQPEPANVVINRFLESMKQIIATRDASAVGRIFDDNFVFKGCKGSYSKAEAVKMLTDLSPESPFSFALKSAIYNNMGQIEYTVTVSSYDIPAFDANFVYCPYRNLLKSGNRPNCPSSRRFMAATQPESVTVVINRFLESMKQIIATRDASSVGRIFDDNFVFKGCKKSYTKTEAVGMLTTFSPESPISFTLKSANYNNQGQIEYTVTVSVPTQDAFDANFVYCPYRNLLKSGNRPNCVARRHFYEFY